MTWLGPASIVTNNLGVGIGAQPDGTSPLQGAMDDVRLYNRALSLAEDPSTCEPRPGDPRVASR